MKRSIIFVCFALLILGFSNAQAQTKKIKPSFFGSMKARAIGPALMSGRISALDAWEEDARLVYVGAATGGVWKTTNGGTTFKDVFEDDVQTIGAIAIDQKHKDTVWVGTGEVWTLDWNWFNLEQLSPFGIEVTNTKKRRIKIRLFIIF